MDPNTAASSMNPDITGSTHPKLSNASNQSDDAMAMKSMSAKPAAGHMMAADDPDNPQNWPYHKKIYVSSVSFAFAWVV